MLKTYNYKAVPFFLLTFLLSWALWGCAIFVSWHSSMQSLLLPLVMGGISGPALATLLLLTLSKNKELWHDFKDRLRPSCIKAKFVPLVLLLFPCQIILAVIVSLFFGQSLDQLSLIAQTSDQVLQGINVLATALVMFLVGSFEELGWRGYGIEGLRKNYSLFKASLLFGAFWGLWHVPLFLIQNGAYQEMWTVGVFHTSLYFIDLFFLTIITNWFYVKNNRSIIIAILFHSIYDLCMSMFHITPVAWIILTFILLSTAVIIVTKEKELFFKSASNHQEKHLDIVR